MQSKEKILDAGKQPSAFVKATAGQVCCVAFGRFFTAAYFFIRLFQRTSAPCI
jgi:hypothetical protein